jgi:hypothetical protein
VSEISFPELTTDLLRQGCAVRFTATGGSMTPTVRDGDLVRCDPVDPTRVRPGDILLYRLRPGPRSRGVWEYGGMRGHAHTPTPPHPQTPRDAPGAQRSSPNAQRSTLALIAHRVVRVERAADGLRFIVRGDASPVEDEPVLAEQVEGRVTAVERAGRLVDLTAPWVAPLVTLRNQAFRIKRRILHRS